MPRFFFHVRDGEYMPDETGVELPTLQEARTQAVGLAGGLLKDDPDGEFWQGRPWRIEVTDEAQVLQFLLTFSAIEPGDAVAA